MEQPTHATPRATEPSGYTLRIPRLNWQVVALILVVLVAGFQTVQLLLLQRGSTANAAGTTPVASTATGSGSSSGLQSQVGGC